MSAGGVSDAIEVTEGAFARVSGLWFTLNDGGGFLGGVDLTDLFDGVGHGVFLRVSFGVGYRKCSARIAGFWICVFLYFFFCRFTDFWELGKGGMMCNYLGSEPRSTARRVGWERAMGARGSIGAEETIVGNTPFVIVM